MASANPFPGIIPAVDCRCFELNISALSDASENEGFLCENCLTVNSVLGGSWYRGLTWGTGLVMLAYLIIIEGSLGVKDDKRGTLLQLPRNTDYLLFQHFLLLPTARYNTHLSCFVFNRMRRDISWLDAWPQFITGFRCASWIWRAQKRRKASDCLTSSWENIGYALLFLRVNYTIYQSPRPNVIKRRNYSLLSEACSVLYVVFAGN